MKRTGRGTRLALVLLAALLALPLAPTAAPVEAKKRSRTVTRTFGNSEGMFFPTSESEPVSAELYPSPIVVSGLKGRIRDVNVSLSDVFHDNPEDVNVLLVGPHGQTAIVMAGVGGSAEVYEVMLRLDDEAAAPLPVAADLQSGAFQPTSATNSAIAFNAPAPEASANAALSVFDGTNPNGTWTLFVQDAHKPTSGGAVGDGWALEITAKPAKNRKQR
jgi:hypothetical protein